jgi:hemerythrin superfamily protein
MDAISYLKQEHKRFRQTLATISKISQEKTKKSKFEAFCQDLTRHETMEQKIWYPVLRKDPELRHIIKHLLSEEKSAAQTIKKFKKVQFEFMWKLRFYKFKHDVSHHAKEEEQELFPKVRKVLSKAQLNALGTAMRKFKTTLK